MVRISVDSVRLHVEIVGWDKIWALKSRIDVPLSNVCDARVESFDRIFHRGLPLRVGTALPGVIIAGSYFQKGKWVFWDVHRAREVVEIDLTGERYSSLALEVADPDAAVATIRTSIQARRR